ATGSPLSTRRPPIRAIGGGSTGSGGTNGRPSRRWELALREVPAPRSTALWGRGRYSLLTNVRTDRFPHDPENPPAPRGAAATHAFLDPLPASTCPSRGMRTASVEGTGCSTTLC